MYYSLGNKLDDVGPCQEMKDSGKPKKAGISGGGFEGDERGRVRQFIWWLSHVGATRFYGELTTSTCCTLYVYTSAEIVMIVVRGSRCEEKRKKSIKQAL